MIGKVDEQVIRNKIANEIYSQFMPICRCENCGTLQVGNLVERIIEIVRDQA